MISVPNLKSCSNFKQLFSNRKDFCIFSLIFISKKVSISLLLSLMFAPLTKLLINIFLSLNLHFSKNTY